MSKLMIMLFGILLVGGCTAAQSSNSETVQTESDIILMESDAMQIEMVFVEGGTFIMGCTPEQGDDCREDENPAHEVTLNDFYIGKYEIKQTQWHEIMGTDIRQQRDKVGEGWMIFGEGDNYPMYYISWNEAQEFIKRLNEKTGKYYRLPTEAEWEYTARGGNLSRGYKYSGSNIIGEVAWYLDNSNDRVHPVGGKKANELGIYDMSGNVSEWVSDWHGSYSNNAQTDPKGPNTGSFRILRNGGWTADRVRTMVSYRFSSAPSGRDFDLGFRLACSSQTGIHLP